MNYDDFMLTLRDLLGFKLTGEPPTFDEMIATLSQDISKSAETDEQTEKLRKAHTLLVVAVDDLLAEAGYDTLFDTREKCLEALRQDIKAKLGTTPVGREVVARAIYDTNGAKAWPWELVGPETRADYLAKADAALALIRPAPAARVVDQEGLAKAMFESSNATAQWAYLGNIGKGWWRNLAASALKYIGATSAADETRARELLSYEVRVLRIQLGDAHRKIEQLRDTIETQKKMRLDLAAEQDKLVAALDEAQNQIAAERKKWPELKAELATACAERAKEVVHNRELNTQVERTRALVRARGLTIALLEKIILGHADPGAVLRDAETGETAHIAPDVQGALRRLIDRARSSERLREANRELADDLVARKPLDRDRIRLALLDLAEPLRGTLALKLNEVNDLADHLAKRLS